MLTNAAKVIRWHFTVQPRSNPRISQFFRSQQIHSTHICRPMQRRYCSAVWSHRGWKGGLRGNREGSQPPTRLPGTLLLQCFTRLPALTASAWHTPQVHQPPSPAKTKQPPANFRGIQLRSVGHGFPPSSPAWMLPGALDWSRSGAPFQVRSVKGLVS